MPHLLRLPHTRHSLLHVPGFRPIFPLGKSERLLRLKQGKETEALFDADVRRLQVGKAQEKVVPHCA